MDKKKIERINELSRKSRVTELTPEELQEQKKLREEYIADFRRNFRAQLDNIEIVD